MVYLIHFDAPLGTQKHQAQHYIGTCEDKRLNERIEEHRSKRGASITAECVRRNIQFKVVRTFRGGRRKERELKNRKRAADLCPVCQEIKRINLSAKTKDK